MALELREVGGDRTYAAGYVFEHAQRMGLDVQIQFKQNARGGRSQAFRRVVREARRDVLPGSDGTRQSPMEKLGAAYWKFEHGLLDKAQLEHVLELTRLAERTQKTTNREDSPSYA